MKYKTKRDRYGKITPRQTAKSFGNFSKAKNEKNSYFFDMYGVTPHISDYFLLAALTKKSKMFGRIWDFQKNLKYSLK